MRYPLSRPPIKRRQDTWLADIKQRQGDRVRTGCCFHLLVLGCTWLLTQWALMIAGRWWDSGHDLLIHADGSSSVGRWILFLVFCPISPHSRDAASFSQSLLLYFVCVVPTKGHIVSVNLFPGCHWWDSSPRRRRKKGKERWVEKERKV